MASYNNKPEQNPFEDSSELGSAPTHHPNRDLIDLQDNKPAPPFSASTSSSSTLQQQELPAPAYIQQQSHLKRGDSSFALDEGKKINTIWLFICTLKIDIQ